MVALPERHLQINRRGPPRRALSVEWCLETEHSLYIDIYMYTKYVYTYIHIYIYIDKSPIMCIYIYIDKSPIMCIYIYIYTYIFVYIYMYINRQ